MKSINDHIRSRIPVSSNWRNKNTQLIATIIDTKENQVEYCFDPQNVRPHKVAYEWFMEHFTQVI